MGRVYRKARHNLDWAIDPHCSIGQLLQPEGYFGRLLGVWSQAASHRLQKRGIDPEVINILLSRLEQLAAAGHSRVSAVIINMPEEKGSGWLKARCYAVQQHFCRTALGNGRIVISLVCQPRPNKLTMRYVPLCV